jgi:hypothetical protein
MNRIDPTHATLQLLALAGALFLLPQFACAQTSQGALTCEDWAAVDKWTGTIHISGSGVSTDQFGNTYKIQESAAIQFSTTTGPGNCGGTNFGWSWDAQNSNITYSVNVQNEEDLTCRDASNHSHPSKATFSLSGGTSSVTSGQLDLDYSDPANPKYFMGILQEVNGIRANYTPDPACGPSTTATLGLEPWGPALSNSTMVPKTLLPATLSTLQGSATYQAVNAFFGAGTSTWTVNWTFTPSVDLDVVLSIQDYATWRPRGGRRESDFADGLIIQGQLYTKSTNQPTSKVLADKWSFNLKQVSHEPGVALNWPPASAVANPAPADLTFDEPVNRIPYPNIQISSDGSLAEIPLDPNALVTGIVLLLGSNDWGGWATLNVNVTIAGQVIKAHFLNDPNTTDILIPKRQANSFIADSWKTAHGIPLSTPDDDDLESNPTGDGEAGDGLSLYEEYRGFYMGCARSGAYPQPEGTLGATCKHVEGDPTKKDLFIASELNAEDNLGIEKFAKESKLNVHYKGLSVQEIGADRLINFNFGAGAHLSASNLTNGQHALHILWDAARNTSSADGGPGIPRKIKGIFLAAGDRLLATTTPGSAGADNYYTATVAHELSHGVNVWHHGEGDAGGVYWYADASGQIWETTSTNALHNPVGGTGQAIQVFSEDQDPRTAKPMGAFSLGLLTDCAAMNDTCPPKLSGLNVNVANRVCGSAVRLGSQHSGDVACYMRYDNAEAYIPSGFPNVRYYPVDEITGQHLTDTPTGTGVNDPSHPTGLGPLSRYGDADVSHNRGNCLSQMDVNDLTDPPARNAPSSCSAR